MPSVSAVLSGAASFGVLAGVLTGVCYVLMLALRWIDRLRLSLPAATKPAPGATLKTASCARCGRRLSVLPLGLRRRLQCAHCRLPVCRRCCAQASNARWLCDPCKKLRDVRLQSGEWFYDQLRQRFHSTVATLGNSDKNDGEVQEFIENLVEAMIGGSLDDVALHPISDRPEYINFCALYKDLLIHVLRRLYYNLHMALSDSVAQDGDTASNLHCELKELMKQIIRDAKHQPLLKDGNGQSDWPPPNGDSPDSLGQRSYEDILATAILNKVFAKYQECRPRRKHSNNARTFDRNSNLLSGKLPSKMQRSESEDSDSTANSMDSWSESSHHEPLSVTIEECIEEVTTRYNSDEEEEPASDIERFLSSLKYVKRQRAPFPELGKDIVDGGESSSSDEEEEEVPREKTDSSRRDPDDQGSSVEQVNPVDTWEENWLFQRRKLKTNMGTCQPVPVPMLVPNPSQEIRAMIGGVDADEMSDLSDCSDSVLEDLVDGPDDKKYFESQLEDESEEEKSNELLNKQREIFLQYISEDLNKMIKPEASMRGLSPDTGQVEPVSSTGEEPQAEDGSAVTAAPKSPEETDSCHSYSVAEARNLSVPAVQVDSGEGSLDMQQDSEYTVAYATLAQVRPSSLNPSPSLSPSPSPSPVPKPRNIQSNLTQGSKASTEEKSDEDQNSVSELSLPPKPGSIAEREHLKWEKAPPLANNPYSKENIARRQRQRMYLSRHSSSENSIEFPELTGTKEPSLLEIDKHRRDDYNKYVRDYYVNVEEGEEAQKQLVPDRPASAEPRSPPRHTQDTKSCSSQQQVSVRVEVEVAVSKPCSQLGSSSQTQTTPHHQVASVIAPEANDSYISLPSVKELAKQFSHPDDKVPTPTSPIPARRHTDLKLHSPVRQVHSLTARNISRELRETLRGSKTSPVIPVVKVACDRELDSSGHVSEDSGTVSPTPCAQPRRLKLQEDIRFWELKQQR